MSDSPTAAGSSDPCTQPDGGHAAPAPAEAATSRTRTLHTAAWLGILLLALIWRLLEIAQAEVWRDEAITIIHTRAGWLDLTFRLPWVEDTPPLVFILFKAWSLLCDREWFLRLLPVLFGTAWVHVMMRTAGMIHPRAWWMAGLLAAFAQVPVHYSEEIRAYSLLLLATGACFWAAEHWVQSAQPRRWKYVLALCAVLAAHAHAVGLFVLPSAVVYLLIRLEPRRWRELLSPGPLLVTVVGLLPMVWFARHWAAIHVAEGWWLGPIKPREAVGLAKRFLGVTDWVGWSMTDQTPFKTWLVFALDRVLVLGSAVLLCLGLAYRPVRGAVAGAALAGVTYIGLLYLASVMSVPNIMERTVVPVSSMVVLALAVSGASRSSRVLALLGHVLVVAISLVGAVTWLWIVANVAQRPPTDEMFRWLAAQVRPQDLIYTTPRWYKDLTVYKLEKVISADQLLDPEETYQGRPPRHRLNNGTEEGWLPRFQAKILDRQNRFGADFNVWVVRYAALLRPTPGTPGEYFIRAGREVGRREFSSDKIVAVVRYQMNPIGSPAASMPASGAPSDAIAPLPK